MIDKEFWKGKKVFLTGHTGFKGGWMTLWLNSMGAEVKGYALKPPTINNLFSEARIGELIDSEINDIRDFDALSNSIKSFSPDIVIHMAAQPLVRYSYDEPLETFNVNIIGTANLLEAIRSVESVKTILIITSDKCYENNESSIVFKETDPMGGMDPYSSSKGCAELVTKSYMASFFKKKNIGLATARAGNVIGGGDWAKDRLIPDILMSFDNEETLLIRSPNAIRPWQHVLEPISGYLLLVEKLYGNCKKYSGAWNFGPNKNDIMSVEEILTKVTKFLPSLEWEIDSLTHPYESKILMLDINKAKSDLDWYPTWSLENSIKKIVDWHMAWKTKKDMQNVCFEDIKEFDNQRNKQ
tara:strand:+ start:673 stop:1737 length:1065 start_codon:yes stop_codon:yes gene_type:complete